MSGVRFPPAAPQNHIIQDVAYDRRMMKLRRFLSSILPMKKVIDVFYVVEHDVDISIYEGLFGGFWISTSRWSSKRRRLAEIVDGEVLTRSTIIEAADYIRKASQVATLKALLDKAIEPQGDSNGQDKDN